MVKRLHWTNETRKLGDLVPWPRNPRQINNAEGERLAESLTTFGQVDVIAIGPDNEVYNGHQRINVWLQEHGPDFEVDVRVASRALTEKEREKLTVYLHRGTVGEWDWDALALWGNESELVEWGFEPAELGIAENVFPDDTSDGPPEMELLPDERYDYVLLTFKQQSDFDNACEVLGLERRRDPRGGWAQHVGLCRVIDGPSVIERLGDAGDSAE